MSQPENSLQFILLAHQNAHKKNPRQRDPNFVWTHTFEILMLAFPTHDKYYTASVVRGLCEHMEKQIRTMIAVMAVGGTTEYYTPLN
jgi:hypothetical protein